jgi:hypothetical protein
MFGMHMPDPVSALGWMNSGTGADGNVIGMRRLQYSVPASWQAVAPGRFRLGAATLTCSELGPLPEDLWASLQEELRGVAGPGFTASAIDRCRLAGGWPTFSAEVTVDDTTRLALALQVLDQGVLATLDGPAAAVAAARAQVLEVMCRATLDWGAPDLWTLAELLGDVEP